MNNFAAALAEANRFILSLAVLAMNGAVWYVVIAIGVNDASKELTMAIVTSAGTFTGLVLGYHFGSSAGSAAKDRAATKPPAA